MIARIRFHPDEPLFWVLIGVAVLGVVGTLVWAARKDKTVFDEVIATLGLVREHADRVAGIVDGRGVSVVRLAVPHRGREEPGTSVRVDLAPGRRLVESEVLARVPRFAAARATGWRIVDGRLAHDQAREVARPTMSERAREGVALAAAIDEALRA